MVSDVSIRMHVRAQGDPSGPCGQVERGFVHVSTAAETQCPERAE